MRYIEVEDGLRVRFPGRGEEFDEGVEIGLLVAQLAQGAREFGRMIATSNLAQARDVVERFGCALWVVAEGAETSEIEVSSCRRRPSLRLVRGGLQSA